MSTENIIALLGVLIIIVVGFAAIITRNARTEVKVETMWRQFVNNIIK